MILSFQLDVVTLSSLCADIHERCHQGQSDQYLGVGGGGMHIPMVIGFDDSLPAGMVILSSL